MTPQFPIRRALAGAGLLLLASLAIKIGERHGLSPETGNRLAGMMLGALVVVYANAVPKALVPLARLTCDPAREQALRRFTGWALVLGGLGYMGASALAPAEFAGTLAMSLLAWALAAVVARILWARRGAA